MALAFAIICFNSGEIGQDELWTVISEGQGTNMDS